MRIALYNTIDLNDKVYFPNSIFAFKDLFSFELEEVNPFEVPDDMPFICDMSNITINHRLDTNIVRHVVDRYHKGHKTIFTTDLLVEANIKNTIEANAVLDYHDMLLEMGVDPKNIILWYNEFAPVNNPKVTSIPINYFELDAYNRRGEMRSFSNPKYDILALTGKINKRNRAPLLAKLMYPDIFKVLHSFYGNDKEIEEAAAMMLGDFSDDIDNSINYLNSIKYNPDAISCITTDEGNSHYCGYPYDINMYSNSKFSLIMETHYQNTELLFLTEKTYRAILSLHPFVMASVPGTCKKLNDDGYHTFECHKLDQIKDDTFRLNTIINQCHLLNQYYNDNKGILELLCKDNYNTLLRRGNSWKEKIEATLFGILNE